MASDEKSKGGRPTKFTPEVRARIIDALADGNYIETACALADVTYRCFREWVKQGQAEGEGEFFQFSQDVTRAMADAEAKSIAMVRTHSADDWRAAAWILERRHPDRWANTQRVKLEVEKEIRGVLDALEAKMSPTAYDELVNALASMGDDSAEKEVGARG